MSEEEPDESQAEETAACEPKEPSTEEVLAQKDKEIAELTDTLKRVQAEFDNFKKRLDREWLEKVKYSNRRLIKDLLPVLDSFDKALEDAAKNNDAASLKKGLEGLRRQLVVILQGEGLREIGTSSKFDPFVHEALMREESEEAEDGRILEVFQKGYVLNSDPLRPAKVKVARHKVDEEQLTDDQENYEDESEER